jgi:hypothetical protein
VRRILLPFPGAWKVRSFGSIDSWCEVLARCGWSFHVSLHRFPAPYVTQSSLSRWEFFTTLDYEWRVIRGRLPYRWTIWVRNDRGFTLVSSAVMCPWADLRLVDLLLCTGGRSHGCDCFPCHYEHYGPNRLSSGYRLLRLPPHLNSDQPQF